jgi:hypothetical protein
MNGVKVIRLIATLSSRNPFSTARAFLIKMFFRMHLLSGNQWHTKKLPNTKRGGSDFHKFFCTISSGGEKAKNGCYSSFVA